MILMLRILCLAVERADFNVFYYIIIFTAVVIT